MEVYLQEIKDLVDQLALACSPICDEDLILLVLNGLPEEYNALKTTIRAKSEVLTMDELCALLCYESIHVEHCHKSGSSSDLTVAFAATHGSNILPQGFSGSEEVVLHNINIMEADTTIIKVEELEGLKAMVWSVKFVVKETTQLLSVDIV
ncbi:unnamed protein product [Camellia sinensis]